MASSSWLKTQRSGKVSERDTLVRRKMVSILLLGRLEQILIMM